MSISSGGGQRSVARRRIEDLLRDSVFYPCSAFDGRPVQLLGSMCRTFVYVDCDIERQQLVTECRERGFMGYDVARIGFLQWSTLFERPRSEVLRDMPRRQTGADSEVDRPFIARIEWSRQPGRDDTHGPAGFTLLFIRLEAVTAYRELYVRRRMAPRCLVNLNLGLNQGGNYPHYREALDETLQSNPGGFPRFLLHNLSGPDIWSPVEASWLKRYREVPREELGASWRDSLGCKLAEDSHMEWQYVANRVLDSREASADGA